MFIGGLFLETWKKQIKQCRHFERLKKRRQNQNEPGKTDETDSKRRGLLLEEKKEMTLQNKRKKWETQAYVKYLSVWNTL